MNAITPKEWSQKAWNEEVHRLASTGIDESGRFSVKSAEPDNLTNCVKMSFQEIVNQTVKSNGPLRERVDQLNDLKIIKEISIDNASKKVKYKLLAVIVAVAFPIFGWLALPVIFSYFHDLEDKVATANKILEDAKFMPVPPTKVEVAKIKIEPFTFPNRKTYAEMNAEMLRDFGRQPPVVAV